MHGNLSKNIHNKSKKCPIQDIKWVVQAKKNGLLTQISPCNAIFFRETLLLRLSKPNV